MRYDPRADPANSEPLDISNPMLAENDLVWKGTSDIVDFKSTLIEFWQQRLQLARRMIRLFALALDLPENYFDAVTTHPGADAVFLHYPGSPAQESDSLDVGIGSHTDIQCLTLLWQDMSGGLQVLSKDGEWLDAAPMEGTFVVNIGDYLQRLSNDKFKSTVHRVYNRQSTSRYSMPFFLGFNAEAVCSVVPTCVDNEHPALYSPISCGKASPILIYQAERYLLTPSSGTKSDSSWLKAVPWPRSKSAKHRVANNDLSREVLGSLSRVLDILLRIVVSRNNIERFVFVLPCLNAICLCVFHDVKKADRWHPMMGQ